MASEQIPRRENKTMEREIHVEEQRDPKMTTHFDVTGGNKDTPKEELKSGEQRKQHAEKARDSKELGTHLESLADKVRGEGEGYQKEKKRESYSDDRVRTQNTVQNKEDEAKREREGGGVLNAGKFAVKAEGKGSGEEARRSKDRAETGGQTTEAKGRLGGETEGVTAVIACGLEGNEQKGRGREEEKEEREENERSSLEEISKCRAEAQQKAMDACRLEGNEQKGRGREEEKEEREENERSSLEEISKYRAEAQQKAMDAISAAQERYQRAKQAASETLSGTTQTAQERSVQAKNIAMEKAAQARDMAAQAKDVTIEKGQQGYVTAKDVTAEKGQQGYVAARDAISSAAKGATDYTAPVAEKAKDYTVQAAEKAKDATVETGKSAAKVAADLKDKATVAGWSAAHFSADKTVEGTRAAANAVQGAAGYAGQKASDLAAMSVDTVKGLAAAAGETAREYTARKKEEAERELEAKKATQPQETKERTSEKTTTESLHREQGQGQEHEGGGTWRPSGAGHTADHVPQKATKPHESNTLGSFQEAQETDRERNQGEAGETISPYAPKMKPTGGSVHQSGQDVNGGNVLTTTGHNVDSAAQRVQKPNENIAGRNFEGEQGGFGQTVGKVQGQQGRKGGEAMTTIGKNVDNAAQREHYPSENITGFQGGQEQLRGRKREDGVGKSLGQVQDQQGRKRTEAMTLTPIGGNEDNAAQREHKQFENTTGKSFQGGKEVVQGKGSEATTSIGETLGDVAHRMKKPLDNVTEGGGGVLGAVGETVAEIGETMMKPAQKVQQQGQEGKGGGVLNAIGETITEIAETTKVLVVGDGEAESRQSIESGSSTRRV